MFVRKVSLHCVLQAAGLALCLGLLNAASPAQADEKIPYLFPAPPLLPAFGPIQLAKGKGYFSQAGLDVTYAVGRGGVDVAKEVGAGNAPLGGIVADGPIMVRQNGGAIVNTASTSGIRWSGSAQVGYASAKAGVIQFSRVVAVQYAKHGIRVNTVVPGQMHTPMVEARLAKQRAGGDVEALLKQRVARIPLGFMGDGRDTAHAALFLASDEARFITGTEIVVDGGMAVRCD